MSRRSKKSLRADSTLHRSESIDSSLWPEWSDVELNAEPWDYPKGKEFSDPKQVVMPESLKPVEWKRFQDLNCVNTPILYEMNSVNPDLITNNTHLLHSEFIREFISTLINVQYCGRNGLEIENSMNNFSWNLGDQCWQGWFHVYSLNKVGKGVPHRPVLNPNGRYIVRIFYMGCWRRILIDDSIPVDETGQPLLPCTSNNNELWPMILAKAMFKVAALSWTAKQEIVDCSLITCLTGWIGLSLNVTLFSPRDQWELLIKYAKHFEWPQDEIPEIGKSQSGVQEKSGKSRKSKVRPKNDEAKVELPEEPKPTLLFLTLESTKQLDGEEVSDATAWKHQVYVELSRDVPLDPKKVKPPLANWKMHRWLDWAKDRGLAKDYLTPIRRLLLVSPLKKYINEEIFNDYAFEDHFSDDSIETTYKKVPNGVKLSKSKIDTNEISNMIQWIDFNKMSKNLQGIHLFYREKFFKHGVAVSNYAKKTRMNHEKKIKLDSSPKEAKKNESKSPGPPTNSAQIYEYSDKTSKSRNEPLYLFVDSLEDKFFLINFSTTTESLEFVNSNESFSLIVERHNWFKRNPNYETVGSIKTRGTKSMIFQLEPGRHLLRIFINYESSYHIVLLSDTLFEIGNREKMHSLMISEAQRVAEVAETLCNLGKKALESFGTSNYATDLKKLYQSYIPQTFDESEISNKKIRKSMHNIFNDQFYKSIAREFSMFDLPMIKRAIGIFFLDPSIGKRPSKEQEKDENEWESDWEFSVEATIIQSFFRMFLVKRYKEIHDPRDKQHSKIKEALSRVIEVFDEHSASYLLREIVKQDKNFRTIFPWVKDLGNVTSVRKFVGQVSSATTNRWLPILRILVRVKKWEIVFPAIDLFVDFPNYTVRVFDNDTHREMPFAINNVLPGPFPHRKNGYTIFAYGTIGAQKIVDWSLHLTTVKGEPSFYSIADETLDNFSGDFTPTKVPPLFLRTISDTYLPNAKNCIFRIFAVVKKTTLVSLRLTTSYERVFMKLRVTKEDGTILGETQGTGVAMLPLVFLEFSKDLKTESEGKTSKPRKSSSRKSSTISGTISGRRSVEPEVIECSMRYGIEAYVLEDSWPLTADEWTAVAQVKTRETGKTKKNRKSSLSGRKSERSKYGSKKSQEIGVDLSKPWWSLETVTDSENDVELLRDTSKEDKIGELTKCWNAEEPGRSERGQKLREKFLEENSLIGGSSSTETMNESWRIDEEPYEEKIKSFEYLSNEFLPKRTLEPPANLGNVLPKLDLSVYMEKEDEEEDPWVKTDFDEETLRNQRAMNIFDFERLQTSCREDFEIMMGIYREKYRRLTQRYLENRCDRARDLSQAHAMRQAFFDSKKDTARSVKSKESKPKKGR